MNLSRVKHIVRWTDASYGVFVTVGLAVLFSLTLCCCTAEQALAQGINLDRLVLDNQAGNATARFGIRLDDTADVHTALVNGSGLALNCNVRLLRMRNYWWSWEVAEKSVRYELYMDPLSKDYLLRTPNHDNPTRHKDLRALLADSLSDIRVGLVPWATLRRGQTYSVRMVISLERSDVPVWMKQTLFFWSWEVLTTANFQMDFQY